MTRKRGRVAHASLFGQPDVERVVVRPDVRSASDFGFVELIGDRSHHLRLARDLPDIAGSGVPHVKILCAPIAIAAWGLTSLPRGHQPCAGCRAAATSLGYVPTVGWIAS